MRLCAYLVDHVQITAAHANIIFGAANVSHTLYMMLYITTANGIMISRAAVTSYTL